MTRRALLLLLLLAGPLLAQQPAPAPAPPANTAEGLRLPAPAEVDAGDGFAEVEAELADANGEVAWVVVGRDPVRYRERRRSLTLGLTPGNVIHVHAVAWTGQRLVRASTVVTVRGQSPAPAPGPTPTPSPGPAPPVAGAKLYAAVVEDSLARAANPFVGGVVNDAGLRSSLSRAGVTLRVIDASDPAAAKWQLDADVRAAGGRLPALVVRSADGATLLAVPLPRTPGEVLAAIERVRR